MREKKSGNISFTRHKCIDDFELVYGEGVLNTFPIHLHRQYCLGAIVKGNAVLILHDREFVLSPGSIYFINPDEPHQIKPKDKEGFDHIVLAFGESFISRYFSEGKDSSVTFTFNAQYLYSIDVLEKVKEFVGEVKACGSLDIIEYKLMLVLLEIYPVLSFKKTQGDEVDNFSAAAGRTHPCKTSENIYGQNTDAVLIVAEYLEKNPQNNNSLQEMAALAGLSKFHFLRLFKDKIGIPPYDYQIQLKIKLARKLLLEGYSAAYTASELGFTDQSHFSRFFKRNVGVTPGRFVKFNRKL